MHFQCCHVPVRVLTSVAVSACDVGAFAQNTPASRPAPITLMPEQQRYHDIYKELVEINTTYSASDTTRATRMMKGRLCDAGFAVVNMQVLEPFPKKGNLVLRFKGSGTRRPMLLLVHIDVVEAKREDQKTDPFTLQEIDGYFTARDAIGDKVMALVFVSVLGQFKQENFKSSRGITLVLTTDEERGDIPTNGAHRTVNNKPELVGTEFGIDGGGGGELRNDKPVLHHIQMAEKMYMAHELEVRDAGGHGSVPTETNLIYALSAALDRLRAYQFSVKLANVTQTYSSRSASPATGQLAEDICSVSTGRPDQAAIDWPPVVPFCDTQLRTTCVITMVNTGHAESMLPQSAKTTVDCRILPHDDPTDIDHQLKQMIGNEKISVHYVNKPLTSPVLPFNGDLVKTVEAPTQQMWNVPVIPAMSTGATDSRFIRNVGTPVYGVSGSFIKPAGLCTHGPDERIETVRLYGGREFLYRFVRRSVK